MFTVVYINVNCGLYLWELTNRTQTMGGGGKNKKLQKTARLDLSSIARAILEIQKDILENAQ